jgi:hypothetical protein
MSKDTTQLAITVGRYEMLVELHEKETKALLEIAERMEQAKAKAETEADLETEAYLWDYETRKKNNPMEEGKMAITYRKLYFAYCDLCGAPHPGEFTSPPGEDDLNNLNNEFDFEIRGNWELHTHTALQSPNCYCGKHGSKKGVWCPKCSAKFWAKEESELVQE